MNEFLTVMGVMGCVAVVVIFSWTTTTTYENSRSIDVLFENDDCDTDDIQDLQKEVEALKQRVNALEK